MPENRTVSQEISHLVREGPSKGPQKGKPYPQKQAVAAALSQQRRGKLRKDPKRRSRSR